MTETTHSDRLSDRDLAEFRTALTELQVELNRLADDERNGADDDTGSISLGGRFVDVTIHGKPVHQLAAVERARDRLDEGTFGLCESCHRQIAVARLEVIPWADTCVGCA